MVFVKHNFLKSDIFFNPIFIPDFSGSRFFSVQVFQGPGFLESGSRVRVQGPGSEFRVQGPGSGSGSRVQVWVQGPGPGFRSSLPNWQFCNAAIIFKLNVLFKILKSVFMIVFQNHLLSSVIIDVEIKLKRTSFLSDSTRFISQCTNTKQMCDIEISLSGFYKSSTQNPSEN